MKKLLLIWLGKLISLVSKRLRVGAGSTWPGHIVIENDPSILPFLSRQLKKGIILIGGTNGKTTTAKMLVEILRYKGIRILKNESGANLLNGIASVLINQASLLGKISADWGIFEVDEATLPLALSKFTPRIIILLNLFRDQLDRYGEVDLISDKWRQALKLLPKTTTVILNADDPQVASLGNGLEAQVLFFGLDDKSLFLPKMEHAVDSSYCPHCGQRLIFSGIFFSHLGKWDCPSCKNQRPKLSLSSFDYPLAGVYNRYNTLAAVLAALSLKISDRDIKKALHNFRPAFGRQEEFVLGRKKAKILLSKNPAGFNESLRTLKELSGDSKTLMFVLNDRIPDGRDVSWIWDVDFEMIAENGKTIISGDRVYDMALRLKYADLGKEKILINTDLKMAMDKGLEEIREGETLYILATYSAMLEVRKIISGRKLL
jgi:UDP-N-acetylmuramyl tripeptide synthase